MSGFAFIFDNTCFSFCVNGADLKKYNEILKKAGHKKAKYNCPFFKV